MNILECSKVWMSRLYPVVFTAAMLVSLIVLIRWINFPISDADAFRQTQTAISTEYIFEGKSFLLYQTPVLGYPWEIPFEFPLYQIAVAIISSVAALNLEVSGRIVSWLSYAGTLVPLFLLLLRLKFDRKFLYIFGSLYLLCPMYLFWGRTFMIETFTVFLGMTSLYFCHRMIVSKGWLSFAFALLFSLACALSKITTYPAFAFIACVFILIESWKNKEVNWVAITRLSLVMFVSVLITYIWVKYTDSVKVENPFGVSLTSSSLTHWTYGPFEQRISAQFYEQIFSKRIIPGIFGSVYSLCIVGVLFFFTARNSKYLFLLGVVAFIIPVMLFSNLFYSHNYYFVANGVFLLFGITALVHGINLKYEWISIVSLLVLLYSMLHSFNVKGIRYNLHNPYISAGEYVKENTNEDSFVIVIGLDWSSEIHYYSKRKGLAVPHWLTDEAREILVTRPSELMGGLQLSAIVWIPRDDPKMEKILLDLLSLYPELKAHQVGNFQVYH